MGLEATVPYDPSYKGDGSPDSGIDAFRRSMDALGAATRRAATTPTEGTEETESIYVDDEFNRAMEALSLTQETVDLTPVPTLE